MTLNINFYRKPEETTREWLVSYWLQQRFESRSGRISNQMVMTISGVGLAISLFLSTALFFPDLFYKLTPFEPAAIEASIDKSVLAGDWDDKTLYSPVNLPDRDDNLPEGNWLIIPKIGVRTQIQDTEIEKMEDALRKGVWREPDFGEPTKAEDPMILIAHRYGYLKWTNQYRKQNSFYNLDKLEIGDTFEIIWDKRRFEYEIYAGEEGKEITDYEADVILYTCKFLNSPIRFFRYARRVEY